MTRSNSISELTRRIEETAITAHALEEMGIKPANVVISTSSAQIFIDNTPAVAQLGGKSCGETYIKGNKFFVYQAVVNNVLVRWLEAGFNAQNTADGVH